MKNNLYVVCIIVILLISNIWLKITFESYKETSNIRYDSVLIRLDSLKSQERLDKFELELAFKKEADNNKLKISHPELYNVLKEKDRIVIAFNERVCTCEVAKCIMDFELNSDLYSDNIILLGSFRSDSIFSEFISHIEYNYKVYNLSKLDAKVNLKGELAIFVTDENLTPHLMYFPTREPSMRDYYFNVVLPNYFRKPKSI